MLRGFWTKPREQRWRGWLFQLHLWSGLAIGLWAILIGLSGSALVFKDEIETAAAPELFRVEAHAGEPTSLDAVAAQVRRRFPEHRILNFRDLERKERSHVVRIVRRDSDHALADQRHVHFHPHSGELLGDYGRGRGAFGFLEELHYYLLLGRSGMRVNGVLAAALALMCATGVVLWWPGRKNCRNALRVKWRAGWKRVNYDCHRTAGLLAAAVLALMAFSGFYFAFPNAVRTLLAGLTGGGGAEARAFFTPPQSNFSGEEEQALYPLDALLARRAELLPQGAELSRITLPHGPGGVYTVSGRRMGNPLTAGYAGAFLDPVSGETLRRFDSRQAPPGLQLSLMLVPLHFGTWGGVWSKGLWLVVGLTPGFLFVTGFLMWWNRVAGKRYRAWKAASAEAPPGGPHARNARA